MNTRSDLSRTIPSRDECAASSITEDSVASIPVAFLLSPLAPLVRVRLIGKGGIQGVRGPETAAMSYENSREKKVSMLRFFLNTFPKVEI